MSTVEKHPSAAGEARLYCFPFAGAGPSLFHSWPTRLSEHLEVRPVQLPGRERLIADAPFTDMNVAADAIASTIISESGEHCPVVLFGHSMGAVLAYEVARLLSADPAVEVIGLIVSGSPAPDRPRRVRASGLSDEDFIGRVNDLAGYRHPALDHPEMRDLILPALRGDVQMHEEYRPANSPTINVPMWAVRGTEDDLVSSADARGWSRFTRGTFEYVEIPGSHMYLTEGSGLSALGDLISDLVRAPRTESRT